ncbi:MAG: GyrI-like domain-containing protein [Pricia sp.]|nr:GyrI-like domain-containing protein [Pricia sp.]
MQPRIELLPEKKLIGHSVKMTLATDKTFELWKSFMANKKQIKNKIGSDLYSVQLYDKVMDYEEFGPHTEFEKWAAIEVSKFENNALNLKSLVLKEGLYAIFIHKGMPSDFQKTMDAIYKDWLPTSGYEVDNRPHFEKLGDRYKNNHPDSEEEVWVPIKKC